MKLRPFHKKVGLRLAGVLFLVVMSAFVTLSIKIYGKDFVAEVPVTLRTDRVGNQLHINSEVKARGVVVGEVRQIHATPSGAELELALEPGKTDRLPKDVAALLIPKTLFGERYVQLSIPDRSTAPPIAEGDVISQDRSANAIELEKVFDDMLPVLQAVQPQKLSTTLTAVATALQGRGEQLGDTLVTAANYLEEFNPDLPKLNENIRQLAEVSKLYGDISPDLLDSLTDAAVTLNTVAEDRVQLDSLYAQVTSGSQDVTTFLRNNQNNLIQLSANSRGPLELAARYSPSFPCTLKALTDLKPSMDKALGAGTDQPGLHIEAQVNPDSGGYESPRDAPVYNATGGPRCYPSGVAPTEDTATIPVGSVGHPLLPGADSELGVANSPQERELLATVLGPSTPDWGSVLVGALYRGTEVTLR